MGLIHLEERRTNRGGQTAAARPAVRRKRFRISWPRLIIFAVSLYFAVTFVSQEAQLNELRDEIRYLQNEIVVQQAEIEALAERRDYLQSIEYVEAEARRRFNLTRPGEIHFLTDWQGEQERPHR